jgi:fluoride exporter
MQARITVVITVAIVVTWLVSTLQTICQSPALRAPIAISLGAIGGALSRYYLTVWCLDRWGTTAFPYATFMINLTGCLGMGWMVTLALPPSPIAAEIKLLLTTGFLGAYTTFSTYGFESLNLFRQSLIHQAFIYWFGSSALGLVAVQIGVWLGEWMRQSGYR